MEDLRDDRRLLALLPQAAARGYLRNTGEAERLRLVAAAVHALRQGKNPPALFVATLQDPVSRCITQAEEEEARQRLRRVDHGGAAAPGGGGQATVDQVRSRLLRGGWTAERWEQAVREWQEASGS